MTQAPPACAAPAGQSKGLAVAALVLGICAIIPCLGLLTGLAAVIMAIIVLATSRPGKGMAITGLVLGLILPLPMTLVPILIPSLGRARELARRTACGANLKALGKAMHIYMVENMDDPPPDIDALIENGLSPKCLECPGAETPGRGSVFVLFPPSGNVPGSTLIACDFCGSHPDGRNVLYFDGTVEFLLGEPAFQAALALPDNAAFAAALRAEEGP